MNLIPRKKFLGIPVYALVFGALQLWPGFRAEAQVAERERPPAWVMTCLGVSAPIPAGEVFKVVADGERLVGKSEHGRFSIPFAGITEVVSGSRRRYPGWDAQMKMWRYIAGVSELRGLAFFPFGVPFLLGSLAFKSRDYVLDILWEEKGVEQEILLAIDKDSYVPFLAELDRRTGKQWTNLEDDLARIEQELKQQASKKISVQIDRRSWVAGIELKPGVYQIVLLPGEEGFGTLYFFEGQAVDMTKWAIASPAMFLTIMAGELPASPHHPEVAARATVEVKMQPNPANPARVIYKEENGILSVAEIHTPEKIFLLPSTQ